MPEKDRLILETECAEITGTSRTFRWREIRAGRFPPRINIPNSKRKPWSLRDIEQWIQCQKKGVEWRAVK